MAQNFKELNGLSFDKVFVNNGDCLRAKNFVNSEQLTTNERIVFVKNEAELLNIFSGIGVNFYILHEKFLNHKNEEYIVVKYSLPKPTKTSNKIH